MEVAVEWVGEDWKQFEKDIEVSDLPERNEILSILRTVSDSNQRKSRLKALNKGKHSKFCFGSIFRNSVGCHAVLDT